MIEVNALKELYQVAEMEVISFSMVDVIATSVTTESSIFTVPTANENTTWETDPLLP